MWGLNKVDADFPDRRRPHHDIRWSTWGSTLVYVTVCTRQRKPWLACEAVHLLLRETWTDSRDWLTGSYVIMPDHVHLIAGCNSEDISLGAWVKYWKSRFSHAYHREGCRWQAGYWDTTLRSSENWQSKWVYVRNNPIRAGLVENCDDWPYQGEIYHLG